MTERRIEPMEESVIRRMAYILGPSSAAARALADFEERRANGEKVAFYREPMTHTLLVGPDYRILEARPSNTKEGG